MCYPSCRDHRPPEPGCATAVAALLERKRIDPSAMAAFLAARHVARFRDLCYSHADGIHAGLRSGILADDLRQLAQSPPAAR